jgi:hypothetical protein
MPVIQVTGSQKMVTAKTHTGEIASTGTKA